MNSGYLTVKEEEGPFAKICFPNDEVVNEFRKIVATRIHVDEGDLQNAYHMLMLGKCDVKYELLSQTGIETSK